VQVKKERILSKATKFTARNLMDSAVHHQMHGIGIMINRSCQKSLGKYCCVGLNTIYFNLYLDDQDYDNTKADSNNQVNAHGPLRKRNWYSALSEEQKEEVRRKKREVYARKKSEIVHHEGTPNIEKTINDGGCQKIGEQCFIINEFSILQVARYKSILRLLSMS
jgi:hypothetical protein